MGDCPATIKMDVGQHTDCRGTGDHEARHSGIMQVLQGCSTLSTEAPLEECVDTAESGGISILIER
jgi:hypothetical protein